MLTTKNDLPEANRTKLCELLNARLADGLDLYSQVKQAHWNVRGPTFYALHKLFDNVAEDVSEYNDEMAERIAQLGGTALGTVRSAAKASTLAEYPLTAVDGIKHVEALSTALAGFGKQVRRGIDLASEARDADTADLFTEISRGTDKWLWMVEAHLHGQKA